MGSNFIARTHPDCNKETLKKWVRDASEEDAFAHGNEYSGYWNMCRGLVIEDKIFNSFEEAEEYLQENTQKWENLLAVRAKTPATLPNRATLNASAQAQFNHHTAKIAAIKKSLSQTQSTIFNFDLEIVNKWRRGKSKFKTCPACESFLRVAYLTRHRCPVCNQEFPRTATEQAAFETAKNKVAALEAQLVQAEKSARKAVGVPETEVVWVVAGWCAS